MARLQAISCRLNWRDLALYGGAFAAPFAAYLLTLAPTAMEQDSTELAVAAYVLGVPHTTGYPLYMLLGKAWQLLVPVGSIAYRMNLLSAVLAAATCAVIAWDCRLLGCRRSAALLGGLTVGFFRIFWKQANVTEVYALSALFLALMFGAFLLWHRRRTERSLIALAFLCGLAFTHHHISLFFSVFFVGLGLLAQRPVRAALLLKVAAALVLPQALYLYLPIRALANPPINWENPVTWEAFWRHVTAAPWVARYGFARRGDALREFVGGVLQTLRGELTLAGAAIGLIGFFALARRRLAFWGATAAAFAIVAVGGSMSPIYRTTSGDEALIPCLLVLALWIALGAQWLAGRVGGGVARWGLPVLAVALPAHMAVVNWRDVDVSRNWHTYDYAQRVLAEAEPGAVIILHGYSAYIGPLYLQVVEGRRRDVDLISVDFSGTDWFPPTVRDRTIRLALRDAQTIRRLGIAGEPEEWTPLLVRVLLSRLEGKRPVYCNVDVDGSVLPPGWEMLTIEPLRRAAPAPGLRFVSQGGTPIGELPGGIAPLAVTPSPRRASRGRVLRLTWRWRIGQPVEAPALVRVSCINQQSSARAVGPPPTMEFGVVAPLGYAVLPLQPTPPGTALAQDIYLVVPRSAAPGRYVIHCALETHAGVSPPIAAGQVEVIP